MQFEINLPGGIDCGVVHTAGLEAEGWTELFMAVVITGKAKLPRTLKCRYVLSDPPRDASVTVFSFGEHERIDRRKNRAGKIVIKRGRRPKTATRIRVEIDDAKAARAIRKVLTHYSFENDGEGVEWREHIALWDKIERVLKRDRLSYDKVRAGEAQLTRRAIEGLIQLSAKTDPNRRDNIRSLFADGIKVAKADRAFAAAWLVKDFESDFRIDDQLGMRLWDMACPEIADDLVRLLKDPRYDDERGPLCLALAKTKDPRAADAIASVLGQALVTRWALEALGKLKATRHVEKIRKCLKDPDADVRREAKKTLKKLGAPVDAPPPPPVHLVKDRKTIPKGLEEWSMNLDMEQLAPILEKLATCVDTGFGAPEIAEITAVVEEMKPDQTRAFRFPVAVKGRTSDVWVVVFLDDIDAPDLAVHGGGPIIKRLESLTPID